MVLLLLGVSTGFIFVYDCFTQSEQFRAREVTVSGNQRLSRQAILAAAGIGPDTNILALNLSVAHKRLLAEPWIAEATIGRDIPSGLTIRVREEQPLALLTTGDASGYLLNPQGRIFKRVDDGEIGPWPRVSGIDDGDLPAPGRPISRGLAAVMALLELAREPSSPLPFADIEEIVLDHEIGLSLSFRGSPRTIRMGFGQYDQKAAVLDELMRRFANRPRLAACKMIDLYDINRIVITLDPDAPEATGPEEVQVAGT